MQRKQNHDHHKSEENFDITPAVIENMKNVSKTENGSLMIVLAGLSPVLGLLAPAFISVIVVLLILISPYLLIFVVPFLGFMTYYIIVNSRKIFTKQDQNLDHVENNLRIFISKMNGKLK